MLVEAILDGYGAYHIILVDEYDEYDDDGEGDPEPENAPEECFFGQGNGKGSGFGGRGGLVEVTWGWGLGPGYRVGEHLESHVGLRCIYQLTT